MTPQRPALAEVLAAMTSESDASWWRMMTTDHETRAVAAGIEWRIADVWAPLRSWRREPETQRSPLRMTTPAEAVEALATARLWPWEPGDDPTRWWCERCLGGGRHVDGTACVVCDHDDAVSDYRGDGHAANPPTLAALVAVASLGAGRLARYVELAGEIARAAGCARARVVWRVMGREKLRLHHATVKWDTRADQTAPAWLFSFQADLALSPHEYMRSLAWRNAASAHEAHPAWPALRDLHGLGLHLVALDGDRITLAVEAI